MSNEIIVIHNLRKPINLTGAIVTIDTLGCQTANRRDEHGAGQCSYGWRSWLHYNLLLWDHPVNRVGRSQASCANLTSMGWWSITAK